MLSSKHIFFRVLFAIPRIRKQIKNGFTRVQRVSKGETSK